VKIKRINEIRGHGHDVIHVIHRHGLDNDTALEVEAALIDAYPGLTNVQGGKGSDGRGLMHYKQILAMYQAVPVVFKHKAVVINVNFSLEERGSVYEAVRYAWRLNPNNARNAELVLAVNQGIVRGVFVPDRWLEATVENFPGTLENRPGRWGFIGRKATEEIAMMYMGRRVPDSGQNPVRYLGPEIETR